MWNKLQSKIDGYKNLNLLRQYYLNLENEDWEKKFWE